MDARCRKTCGHRADDQVVWSWRPWAGAKSARRFAGDGDSEVMDTGESSKQPLKPPRRECRCFGFICGDYTCVLSTIAHKAAGAVKHPAFPAPSAFRGACRCKARTRWRRGNAKPCKESVSGPILRDAACRPLLRMRPSIAARCLDPHGEERGAAVRLEP